MDSSGDSLEKIWKAKFAKNANISGISRTLKEICGALELKHFMYMSAAIGKKPTDRPLFITNFPDNWIDQYIFKNQREVDPAISLAMSSTLPVNWSAIKRQSERVREYYELCSSFDIGRTGMTVCVHGPAGSRALFMLTSDVPEAVWQTQSARLETQITYLAALVNERVCALQGGHYMNFEQGLSLMEKSCLQWTADGMTMEQAAQKMKLSERTVRMHLSSARAKLNARNTTHAVALMMRRGQLG